MKIHLKRAAEPLTLGRDIEAQCGEIVPKVAFALVADTNYSDIAHLNSLAVCSKCFAIRGEGRYLYALAPGQEAMTEVPC